MDSGAAMHVVIEGMFPRVKIGRKNHQIGLWQRVVNKLNTWVTRPFFSRQMRRFTDA